MTLERYCDSAFTYHEQHSVVMLDEVFTQMQASVPVKTKKAPSQSLSILFTNIFSKVESETTARNGMATANNGDEHFTIKADGSILLNC